MGEKAKPTSLTERRPHSRLAPIVRRDEEIPRFNRRICFEIDFDFDFDSETASLEESPDWTFCTAHATWRHRDSDACEFILHIGTDPDDENSAYRSTIAEMREAGCTERFVELYTSAKAGGADLLMIYA
jgi:hypothetical protein